MIKKICVYLNFAPSGGKTANHTCRVYTANVQTFFSFDACEMSNKIIARSVIRIGIEEH